MCDDRTCNPTQVFDDDDDENAETFDLLIIIASSLPHVLRRDDDDDGEGAGLAPAGRFETIGRREIAAPQLPRRQESPLRARCSAGEPQHHVVYLRYVRADSCMTEEEVVRRR